MKKIIISVTLVAAIAVLAFVAMPLNASNKTQDTQLINPLVGEISQTISTTGTVHPRNRLEVMPTVAGRLDKVLVEEGQQVKAGQVVAIMSSTERATLLDAARAKGDEELKYWQEVYKPIPMVAPMDGTVIVSTLKPGQSVAIADPIVVLADELIVQAQVDETDISRVALGQKTHVTLDAFADKKTQGVVERIYYESKTVSNVTTYTVDVAVKPVPEFFRSGMNAQVEFEVAHKKDILLLPIEAVTQKDGRATVLVPQGDKTVTQEVVVGLSDDKSIEIVSGLTAESQVVLKSKKFVMPTAATEGKNPFMPTMPRAGSSSSKAKTK